MRGYNGFARVLRWGYRAIHPRWRVLGEALPEEPVVFVVHHQNLYGPIHAIGLLPRETHMWSLYVFRDREACFDQFYNYTYRQRYGWPKAPAYVVARVLSWVIPGVLRSLDVIPVYHDAQAIRTIRMSLEALGEGRSLTICPDVDYSSDSSALGEVYTGFLLLGQQYQRRTGMPLRYVPTYVSKRRREIVFGAPLTIDMGLEREMALREMAGALRASMNALGVRCGDIQG